MSNPLEQKFECIIPSIVPDYLRSRSFIPSFFKYLPIKKIVFIGPLSLKEQIDSDITDGVFDNHDVSFLEEGALIPFAPVKEIFSKLIAEGKSSNPSSVNWYYQQFLKMGYSNICEDEYYLSWDADTLPLRKIEMFAPNGKPFLDVKYELQESYFLTINRLFGFTKVIENSFISEHMLFNKELMQEMISEIEKTDFEGIYFYEKIMSAVGPDNLYIGFSEFETYGTWVAMRHQSKYRLRNWKSFRNTNFFVNISDLTQEDMDWLAISYDAASFEKYQETEEILTELFRNPRYREKLTPEQFYLSILESGAMGEYKDGKLINNDGYAPI
ncbi:DUF6492 family protein [Butyrivibrio sp. INlla14]|uniref:DUF6492 family protein n=1 Tax=Butyrivibrio sp. INlla14 TaxID=1520808 RepID=UPI0008765B32|nr:DUF6492 family protein [Butyrivibrio sp. INlla14]SCY34184.1 hypothetical protein SAMN02910371_01934 [Butyrivibrio sp. INlla14]